MNIMHLSRAEYQTLSTNGTLTKAGVTYTFDPINTEYVVPDHLYKHSCNVIVGSDDAYFTGYIVFINRSPDPMTINNETIKTAIEAYGEIRNGPSDYTVEDGIIGIITRKIPGTSNIATYFVARPDTNTYYGQFNFDDHTNYSVTDIITEL